MNTLCGKKVLQHKEADDPTAAHVEEGVKIQPVTVGMYPCGVPPTAVGSQTTRD